MLLYCLFTIAAIAIIYGIKNVHLLRRYCNMAEYNISQNEMPDKELKKARRVLDVLLILILLIISLTLLINFQ